MENWTDIIKDLKKRGRNLHQIHVHVAADLMTESEADELLATAAQNEKEKGILGTGLSIVGDIAGMLDPSVGLGIKSAASGMHSNKVEHAPGALKTGMH